MSFFKKVTQVRLERPRMEERCEEYEEHMNRLLLYESLEREPGWRFTARFQYGSRVIGLLGTDEQMWGKPWPPVQIDVFVVHHFQI